MITAEFLVYFILLALVAEILGTIGGFGSSMLFVPIAGLFFDFHSVLGITALFHLSSNITKIVLFKKGFDKTLILKIGIPSVIFVIAGAYMSRFFDNVILEIFLACSLIILSVLLLIYRSFALRPTTFNALWGGSLSGLMAGLLGTGGAIRGLALAAFDLKKEIFIATSAIIDLGVDLSRSVVYYSNGFMHYNDLYLVPILFVVSVIGTYIGKKLLNKLPEHTFKRIVLFLILTVGLFTLTKQLWPLIAHA